MRNQMARPPNPLGSRAKGKRGVLSVSINELGALIRDMPDPDARQVAANHIAQWMSKKFVNFDPTQWNGATGGRLTGAVTLDDLRKPK